MKTQIFALDTGTLIRILRRKPDTVAFAKFTDAVVNDADEVYILGDFAYRGQAEQVNDILKKLKGRKYLIKGNHELYLKDRDFDASAFEWIKDYHVLKYKDARFVLFHFPILEWAYYHYKTAHLHGHIHNRLFNHPNAKAINVSVDCNAFYPVSADAIYARAFTNFVEQEVSDE